jgi:hypothetical protein
MKKIFFLALTVMSVLSAHAQFEPGRWSVEPRLGATGSTMTNMPDINLGLIDETLNSTAIGGFFVGADMEYQATNWLGLSAGINYSQAGSGWEDFTATLDGVKASMKDMKIQTAYFNIPVTANFYIWKGLAVRSGLQFGFLTSAKSKGKTEIKAGNTTTTSDDDEDVKDAFKTFDLSIPVGLSYEFGNHLVIDARYNIGVTKVNKESFSNGKDSRNGVFVLSLGYKLGL